MIKVWLQHLKRRGRKIRIKLICATSHGFIHGKIEERVVEICLGEKGIHLANKCNYYLKEGFKIINIFFQLLSLPLQKSITKIPRNKRLCGTKPKNIRFNLHQGILWLNIK